MLRHLLAAALCLPTLALAQSFPTKFPTAGFPAAGAQGTAAPSAVKFGARPRSSPRPAPSTAPPPNSPYRASPAQVAPQPARVLSPEEVSSLPVSGANKHLRRVLPPLRARGLQPGNASPSVDVGAERVRLRPIPLRDRATDETQTP